MSWWYRSHDSLCIDFHAWKKWIKYQWVCVEDHHLNAMYMTISSIVDQEKRQVFPYLSSEIKAIDHLFTSRLDKRGIYFTHSQWDAGNGKRAHINSFPRLTPDKRLSGASVPEAWKQPKLYIAGSQGNCAALLEIVPSNEWRKVADEGYG